ncbi:MAG: hypothetical protein JNJ42_13730 [Burkholderiaceae bacterium]|nr:hypothetical protein [Burkholderiaceae bacterium]
MKLGIEWARAGQAAVVLALCAMPALASADDSAARIRALEEKLERSVQQIEALKARVAELEKTARVPGRPAGQGEASAATSNSPSVSELQQTVNQLSEGLARTTREPGLPLHGFADVSVATSGRGDPQRLRGFQAGTLDVYLTPQVGDRGRALIETVFEYVDDGSTHVETERLQLGYTVSDALTVWMGRFHTPLGLWNTSFHHGTHLQTSLARPRFMEFEDRGGILPTHTVGLWATGRGRLGDGRFGADAFVGNGPAVHGRELDINAFKDDNGNLQFGGSFSYMPSGALRGLTLGMHAMGATVHTYGDTDVVLRRNRWRLAGVHAAYDDDVWNLLAEAHDVRSHDLDAASRAGSTLWYLQLGRELGAWTPYARFERAGIDAADTYFASLRNGRPYRRMLAGVRYDLDARSALKLEVSRTNESDASLIDGQGLRVPLAATRYHRAAVEYSIAF